MSFSKSIALLVLLVVVAGSTGCTIIGPQIGPIATPIPISPFFQDREEQKFRWHERYARAPILGPLTAEGPDIGMDPPSDDQVMMAFEKAKPLSGSYPFLYEAQRNNVRIVKDKIADYIDPPRDYPLIGPAQVHHVHYKCTVYYSEKQRIGWPVPYTKIDEDAAEVIYIDKTHLHMVGNVDTGRDVQGAPTSNF